MERANSGDLNKDDLRKEWPGDKEAFEKFREHLREIFQNMGVCSFSASPDELLLWSHYADHHKGFCVEYSCAEGTSLRSLAREVQYKDEVPRISAADFAGHRKNEVFDSLWLTKARCWSYEKEWRVMMPEGDKEYQTPSQITSIIFGARMPAKDRATLMNILHHCKEIDFKEAALAEGEFRLEIRNLARP
jgi:hypothetical protein